MFKRKEWDKYDELIKQSLTSELDSIPDVITDEEMAEMGYPPIPAELNDKIMNIYKEKMASNPRKRPRKLLKLIVVAAAILALLIGAMSVEGVRVYVFGIVSRITDDSIEFRGINENAYSYDTDESNAYKSAEDALGTAILKPTYLPEGYVFDNIKIYPNQHVTMIYKNKDNSIRINQTLLKEKTNTGEMVDTKKGSAYTINAHGKKIAIAEHDRIEIGDKWLSAVWDDEVLTYKAEGNCTKDEFVEFIKNLK